MDGTSTDPVRALIVSPEVLPLKTVSMTSQSKFVNNHYKVGSVQMWKKSSQHGKNQYICNVNWIVLKFDI